MGLSAFNAMRARLAKEEAEKGNKKPESESTIKVTEVTATENEKVEEPTEEVKVESKPKKKTDAEKLKKE